MIGMDLLGADETKWGSGGEGDVGPPARPAPKPVALEKRDAPVEEAPAPSKKWLLLGGLAAAVVGALIFFFTGGAEKVR